MLEVAAAFAAFQRGVIAGFMKISHHAGMFHAQHCNMVRRTAIKDRGNQRC